MLICGRGFRPPAIFGVGGFDGVCVWDFGDDGLAVSAEEVRLPEFPCFDAAVAFPFRATIGRRFVLGASSAELLGLAMAGKGDAAILDDPILGSLGDGASDIVIARHEARIRHVAAYVRSTGELMLWPESLAGRKAVMNFGDLSLTGVRLENGYTFFKVPVEECTDAEERVLATGFIAIMLGTSFGLIIYI